MMFDGSFLMLSMYFLKHLAMAIAFLIPFLILRMTNKQGVKSTGLTYMSLGFFIGFIAHLLGGFLGAYVCKLPILPLLLRQQNLGVQEISRISFLYSVAFDILYLGSLFISLTLVGYGVYALIKDLNR